MCISVMFSRVVFLLLYNDPRNNESVQELSVDVEQPQLPLCPNLSKPQTLNVRFIFSADILMRS